MKDAPNPLPWWGRLSSLYLMTPPLAVFLFALGSTISPNDYWYHVRAGFLQAQLGHIPTANLMSDGLPLHHPYYYQSWIAERVMYELLHYGGLAWTTIFRAAWMGGLWMVLMAVLYRRMGILLSALDHSADENTSKTAAAKYAALGGLLGFLLAFNNMDIRPQLFSYGFFAVFAAVLFNRPFGGRAKRAMILIGLSLLMLLWANTHGAFVTGLILIGGLAVGEVLHALWNWKMKGSGPREWKFLGVLLLACAAAAAINPHGAAIYPYVMELASLPAGQLYIQEWQSPSGRKPHDWIFFISIALSVLAFVFIARKNRTDPNGSTAPPESTAPPALCPSEFLVLMGLAVMGLRDLRAIIWFALWLALCAPPLVASLRATLGQRVLAATPTTPPRGLIWLNLTLGLVWILGCVPALPWFKPDLPLPHSYLKEFAPTPQAPYPQGFSGEPPLLLSRDTPIEAAAWLRAHPPRGRLFNDMVYGSYLTWALYPQTRPYVEPRVELYPLPFWKQFMHISSGAPDASNWLQTQGFTAALVHPKSQKKLVQRLRVSPKWKSVDLPGPARLFILQEK